MCMLFNWVQNIIYSNVEYFIFEQLKFWKYYLDSMSHWKKKQTITKIIEFIWNILWY